MPIFGIRGLNSGVEDAWNLGWKLAFVHKGQAREPLLDSYSAERRAVFLENIALADRNAWFMTPPSPGARLLRDAVLELALTRLGAEHAAANGAGKSTLLNTVMGLVPLSGGRIVFGGASSSAP